MDPVLTLKRIGEAVTLRRPVFVWMQFEPNATGDAIVIVGLTSLLLALFAGVNFSVTGAVSIALSSLVAWLVISGLTWAAARFVFDARNDYAPVLRVAGFAFPTLLSLVVTLRLIGGYLGLLIGFGWFIVVMAAGTQEVMDMEREQALGAAALGFVGWLVIQWILGGGFI